MTDMTLGRWLLNSRVNPEVNGMKTFIYRICAMTLAFVLAIPIQVYAHGYQGFPGKQVIINGEVHMIIQEDNVKGRLVKQVITGPRLQEISLDTDGDGTLDHWEVAKDNIKISASNPYRGNFVDLEIHERRQNGIFEVKMELSRNRREYVMRSARLKPFSVQFRRYQERVVVGSCLESDKDLAKFQADFRDALLKWSENDIEERKRNLITKLKEDALQSDDRMRSLNPPLIDKSCMEEPFKKSFDTILDGIAEVMVSGTDTSAGRPKYLRCLEDYGLGVHAARIEQDFEKLVLAPCEVRKTSPVVCQHDSKNLSNFGSYSSDTDQVFFHRIADDWDSRVTAGKASTKAKPLFSDTFFHEMLHKSGIDDESLVKSAENCCGSSGIGDLSDGGRSQSSCSELEKKVKDIRFYQAMRNTLVDQVPGYHEIRNELMQNMGNAEADRMLDLFGKDVYQAANTERDAYLQCREKPDESGSCGGTCTAKCAEAYTKKMGQAILESATKNCEAVREDLRGGLNCSTFSRRMLNAFAKMGPGCVAGDANNAFWPGLFHRERSVVDLLLTGRWALADATGTGQCLTEEMGQVSSMANRTDTPPINIVAIANRGVTLTNSIGQETNDINGAAQSQQRLFSVVPRNDETAEKVSAAQPIRKENLTPGPMPIQRIELGSERPAIIARADRADRFIEGAKGFLKVAREKVGDSILPSAQAAADRSPSLRSGGRAIAESSSRIARFNGDGGASPSSQRGLAFKNSFKDLAAGATKDAGLRLGVDTPPVLTAGANIGSDKKGSSFGSGPSSSSVSSPRAAVLDTHTSMGSDSSRASGTGVAGQTMVGAGKASTGSSVAGTGSGSTSTMSTAGSATRKPSDESSSAGRAQVKNPLRKKYPNHTAIEKFLGGKYSTVYSQLKDTNFVKILIDERIQVTDHEARLWGSRHPESIRFKFSNERGVLIRGDEQR